MDGVFLRGRFLKLQNILGLVCGIILALMFGFFNFVGAYETLGDRLASWVFVIFGLFVAALCAVSLYVNKRLFIRVEGERITGYCQFGLSLDCALEDVKSVSYGGTGLNLRLKNGKSYNLMNLENACQLGCYIEKRLPREALPEEDEETILARLAPLGKRRLKTGLGLLTVHGQGLQLKNLSLEGGQVAVDGSISAFIYEEPRSGGLRRLLR